MKYNGTNQPWYADGDPWVLTQTEWEPGRNIYFETILTQSNGYMGIRGYTEETNKDVDAFREGYLAGVFGHVDEAAMEQIQVDYEWPMLSMITLPELFACEITLNDERFTLSEGTIAFFSRSLDMRNGVLKRHVDWVSPTGLRTRLQFERFLSMADPHLAFQRITVTPENWSGKAEISFALDGTYPTYFRCGDRSFPHLKQDLLEDPRIDLGENGAPGLAVTVRGTGHTVSLASNVAGGTPVTTCDNPAVLRQTVSLDLEAGGMDSVLHSVAVFSSRDGIEPAQVPVRAARRAREAMREGYEAALAASEAAWQARWAVSDVQIDGPARDQAYIRYSAFSMLQMAPFHTDTISVPARAYAFNRYHGLYYWDSETFLMPHYLHTHPEAAGHLLHFRYRTLDGARRNAQHLEAPGACFPWMTDSDDGTEQGPWGIGDYLWHQNADIAYAIDQYVRVTGDTAFMRDKGLEMIVESARFWMSRVKADDEGVMHLHHTVGPDELDNHGRDNGYTSLLARRHLRLAKQWVEQIKTAYPAEAKALIEKLELTVGETEAWTDAADRLAVPSVPGLDIPLQDEFLMDKEPLDFSGMTADEAYALRHTHRVVKQADIIVAMYLLQDEFTVKQMRTAYDFYEPMTLHFSSLSYNTHAIIATKIGRDAQAYDYFMKAAGLDLDNLRGATKDGLHAAALAGTWQTVAYGFLGMHIKDDALVFDPRLPEDWKSIRLKIKYRGYLLDMTLTHDKHTLNVDASAGRGPASVVLNGESYALSTRHTAASSQGVLN